MKYKLKEDFAGKKAGDILYMEPCGGCSMISWMYKNIPITIVSHSELVEEVKDEPLFYTNEDEVYLDGKSVGLFNGDLVHLAGILTLTYNGCQTINSTDIWEHNKLFLTIQAAKDYIKLQQAIKDSGLKIGDKLSSSKLYNRITLNYDNKPISGEIIFRKESCPVFGSKGISKFVIYKNIPCVVVVGSADYPILVDLSNLKEPKLLFGDKEVNLETYISKLHDEDFIPDEFSVKIKCNAEECDYYDAKKFRDAITTIQNFKFGSKSLDTKQQCNLAAMFTFPKIGCTTGTLEQIDNILLECEKLLKL